MRAIRSTDVTPRRGFLGRLAALALGGFGLLPLAARPARAGTTTRLRRWYRSGYGYPAYGYPADPRLARRLRNDTTFRRRFYGPRPYLPPAYGYPPPIYGYPAPYGRGGFQFYIGPPRAYRPLYPPMMRRGGPAIDPLALLEA